MSIARNALLAASTNTWLRERAVRIPFVRRSVRRFMPGERADEAVAAAAVLNERGASVILTHLGENLSSGTMAEAVTDEYLLLFEKIAGLGLAAQISVKPTQLGLDQDSELCRRNVGRLIERAERDDNFVWLDMESAPYVDRTLDLFRTMRQRSRRVGVALQAYLYRTEADVESLLPMGASIRLVKGAYLEPPSIAFPRKADVDANYFRLACRILDDRTNGSFLQIATHDSALVERLSSHIAVNNIQPASYEHAMLYGIRESLQRQLLAAGRPLRILISYGTHWFPWYMRRLAERPANVMFVIRSLVEK